MYYNLTEKVVKYPSWSLKLFVQSYLVDITILYIFSEYLYLIYKQNSFEALSIPTKQIKENIILYFIYLFKVLNAHVLLNIQNHLIKKWHAVSVWLFT